LAAAKYVTVPDCPLNEVAATSQFTKLSALAEQPKAVVLTEKVPLAVPEAGNTAPDSESLNAHSTPACVSE
jgi:hypothetical protein